MALIIATTLRHLTILTWEVPLARLASCLQKGVTPTPLRSERGLLSAVVMEEEGMRFAALPFLRASFPQLNERTYVEGAAGKGACFFLSRVASSVALVPALTLGLPYVKAPLGLRLEGGILTLRIGGALALAVQIAPGAAPSNNDLVEIVANPMVGYTKTHLGLGAFLVTHDPIVPRQVAVLEARPSLLFRSEAGRSLLPDLLGPPVALYAAESVFRIMLPPRRV